MKRIFALLIAFILLVSFCGCGNEVKDTELHEEILLNFGGTYRHDGSLIVSRKGSFYDFREGIEDCSALTPDTYYTWVASGTDNSNKTKVVLSGYDSEVYVYPADFVEELQKSDYYYPEQNCYYFDGVSSAGEYVSIDYVSAEKNEDILTIHFTLSDLTNGITSHALNVKLLPDGGYNYVSYIAK